MLPFFLYFAIFLLFSNASPATCSDRDDAELRNYVVTVRRPDDATIASLELLDSWHRSFLPETAADSNRSRIIYSYSHAISGFAAKLTEEEVQEMAKKEGFLKAHPDRTVQLLTTHTPAFLGLQPGHGLWNTSGFGKGVIIGMMDTGVAAMHPSFDDRDMPPPPPTWKGKCAFKVPSGRCNNKLIGAREFLQGSNDKKPPVDNDGHGTHTASTAAGNFLPGAELLGNINGTATGMAPHAHLAIYKVCTSGGCQFSDVLAGFDAAIEDGVNVISMSLGMNHQPQYYDDPFATATFAAVEKGIFVSCSGGNAGPWMNTVTNSAPWVLTVAASTIDRNVRATVKLGDGQEFDGQSAYQPHDFSSAPLPLVLPDEQFSADACEDSLNVSHVKSKMVLCQLTKYSGPPVQIGEAVKAGGGAAMILVNDMPNGYTTFADPHVLPASHVSSSDGEMIQSYMDSANNPTASIIFKGTIFGISPAPSIAYFSSRGPNPASRGILKPDITGPGVSVLAAWPSQVGPPNTNHGKVNFNAISGTSMSTPHLSGIAALLKSMHPNWSPAAIKSAIMTTADTRIPNGEPIKDEQLQPASVFLMGAGHVNPLKAVDPGLVYDIEFKDYIGYLCGLGYKDDQVEHIIGRRVACANIKKITEFELNYPSITLSLSSGAVSAKRTVTNVGNATATYKVEVEMKIPDGVSITVKPKTLQFSRINEKRSFTVNVTGQKGGIEGSLKWVSDKHIVASPMVIL